MKKTLFIGLLAAAIMALSFTGCKNNADLGTAPKLTDFFITTNSESSVSSTELNTLQRITTVTTYPDNTPKDNATVKYREVLVYNDPDIDIVRIEFSFDNFQTIITDDEFTQDYEYEILTYKNQYYYDSNIPRNPTTYSVRLVDSKGNVSNVLSISLSKN